MKNDHYESLAESIFKQVNPNTTLVPIKDQSHGQHDFDIKNRSSEKIGIMEVTSATYEKSKKSKIAERKITSKKLQYDWFFMAHNPDFKKMEKTGCKHLATLEEKGIVDTDCPSVQHLEETRDAVTYLSEIGFISGYIISKKQNIGSVISGLTSYGENDHDFALSEKVVIDRVKSLAEKGDNRRKISNSSNTELQRHFFVVLDSTNLAEDYCMKRIIPTGNIADLWPDKKDEYRPPTDIWITTYDSSPTVWHYNQNNRQPKVYSNIDKE